MVLYEYINRLNQWLATMTFNDSPTIKTTKTSGGWELHSKIIRTYNNNITITEPEPLYSILCITTGELQEDGYPVDVYGNGYEYERTASGIITILTVLQFEELSIGSKVNTLPDFLIITDEYI